MVFEQIGFGSLSISNVSRFKISFVVEDCPICRLFPNVKDKKTCMITADAISQFFLKDIDIENETTEVRCKNNGEELCEFQVDMQPLGCYQIIFDEGSNRILKSFAEKPRDEHEDLKEFIIKVGEETGLDEEDALYRVMELREYMLLDDNYSITGLGETYYNYIKSPLLKKEKKFDPPWLNLKIISDNIADSASFANAFSKSASTLKDMKEKAKRKDEWEVS
ncbi:MAG: hypothetical protein QXT63_00080 [Thermoplasmata archaeon]